MASRLAVIRAKLADKDAFHIHDCMEGPFRNNRSQNIATTLACLILLLSCGDNSFPDGSRALTEDEFVGLLRSESIKASGRVNLSKFGWKVCVSPDGVGSGIMTHMFFDKLPVRSVNTDQSEGVWYVAIQKKESDQFIDVLGVHQKKIRWGEIDEKLPVTSLIVCNNTVSVGWFMEVPRKSMKP